MGKNKEAEIDDLEPGDVVIVPAFGTEVSTLAADQGARLPDRRHDLRRRDERLETRAANTPANPRLRSSTAKPSTKRRRRPARARSVTGNGHYLVVLTLAETDYVCDYIRHGGNKQEFLEKFRGAYSAGLRSRSAPAQRSASRTRRR